MEDRDGSLYAWFVKQSEARKDGATPNNAVRNNARARSGYGEMQALRADLAQLYSDIDELEPHRNRDGYDMAYSDGVRHSLELLETLLDNHAIPYAHLASVAEEKAAERCADRPDGSGTFDVGGMR